MPVPRKDLCEVYWLDVEGGRGQRKIRARIVARCMSCGATPVQSGIVECGPTGLWGGADLRQAIQDVCYHMVDHTTRRGMAGAETIAAFGSEDVRRQIRSWALPMMHEGSVRVSDEHGWTVPGYKERGIVMRMIASELREP